MLTMIMGEARDIRNIAVAAILAIYLLVLLLVARDATSRTPLVRRTARLQLARHAKMVAVDLGSWLALLANDLLVAGVILAGFPYAAIACLVLFPAVLLLALYRMKNIDAETAYRRRALAWILPPYLVLRLCGVWWAVLAAMAIHERVMRIRLARGPIGEEEDEKK